MTNIVRFPNTPPPARPPAVDALISDLAAVELELARARLAQVRSETRQASVLLSWYVLKRIVFWGILIWLLATVFAKAAEAGSFRTFYNANGGYEGSSSRPGNGRFTNFYDRNGQYVGTEVRRGRRR